MRAYEIDLQFAHLIADNVDIAQFADTSGDGVGDFVIGNKRIDDSTSAVHGFARVGSEQHRPFFDGGFAHRLQSQVVSVNMQSLQKGFLINFSISRC